MHFKNAFLHWTLKMHVTCIFKMHLRFYGEFAKTNSLILGLKFLDAQLYPVTKIHPVYSEI